MSIFLNFAFGVLIFWIAAKQGFDSARKLDGDQPATTFGYLVESDTGVPRPIMNHAYVIVMGIVYPFFLTLYGGIIGLAHGLAFNIINWTLGVNLKVWSDPLDYWAAFIYGLIMAWGFYVGKACFFEFCK